jgi:nitrate/TMAO reductase-like tetraheme cytochrome c subunit
MKDNEQSTRRTLRAGTARLLAVGAAAIGLALAAPATADEIEDANQECFDCHESEEDEVLTFGDKATKHVQVDPKTWGDSIHGGELKCTDCHRQISEYPHPEVRFGNAREYRIERSDTCKRCHYAYHTRMLDSIHYKVLEEGNKSAPTCVDCHGAHDVGDPSERQEIPGRCATCHEKVSMEYAASVHGQALTGPMAVDVPVCTDCHGAHDIKDPGEPQFHASSYNICGKCHGDADKMERHGLNPDVVDTFLDDFHGRSNELYAMGAGRPGQPIATCTDCHGVHDIQSFRRGDATAAEVKERVIVACRKCHEDAPLEFADAWLSHYQPTLESAPLVWAVQWGYRILIPLIMVGLVLHILLHLWRVRTHR